MDEASRVIARNVKISYFPIFILNTFFHFPIFMILKAYVKKFYVLDDAPCECLGNAKLVGRIECLNICLNTCFLVIHVD